MSNNPFNVKKLVLMYRQESEEKFHNAGDMFVMLDQASGGYPARTNMLNAHDFKSLDVCQKYDGKGEFIIASLEITGIVVIDVVRDKIRKDQNIEKLDEYQRRLKYEELKKEFG